MRQRPFLWLLISVACFVGAVYFWRLGDKWQSQKSQPSKTAPADSAEQASRPHSANSFPSTSKPINGPAVIAGIQTNQQSVVSNQQSAFPYRVSNTSQTAGQLARNSKAILLENAFIDSSLPLNLNIPASLRAQGDPGTYIVQSRGAINDAFRAQLKASGAQIVSYIPNNAYLVRASASIAQELSASSQVQTVLPYEPQYKLKSSLLKMAMENQQVAGALNLVVFPDAHESTVAALKQMGATVVAEDRSPFGPVLTVQPGANKLTALAGLSGVATVEPYYERVRANDLTRSRLRVATNSVAQTNYLGLTGANVIVALNDSGVDATHPDLISRILSANAASGFDTNGHGTHVAGIIAGDGTKSTTVTGAKGSVMPGTNGQFRGMAPGAKLYSISIFDDNPSDYFLQTSAAKTNALISNNSWGYNANDYNIAAASYDAAVRDALPGVTGSQPVLFVFAAGNSGNGDDNGLSGDAGSVVSPAVAKNVITVGAIENFRNITNEVTKCPASPSTNNPCTTNQPWLGWTDSSNRVASFSSRGNVGIGTEGDFGRFKPDVVAPGTFVVSTRSATWDQNAYYSPTSYFLNVFKKQTVETNSFNNYSLFVPDNAVRLDIFVDTTRTIPSVSLPIYVKNGNIPTTADFSKLNEVLLPPDMALSPVGSTWFYSVGNPTNVSVRYDIYTELAVTNDLGNYFQVLSNLNDSLGGTNSTQYYRYETGTSMSAPAVSGTLALMQEFFQTRLTMTNSPALMKALLINGARSVSTIYDFQVNSTINYQGWGLVNLTNSLPSALSNKTALATGPGPVLIFDQSPTNALATEDSRTFNISIAPTAQNLPLRVTLVWTDPPGNPAASLKLVNNLDLVVTNLSDTNEIFFGNDILAGNNFNQPWDTTATAPFDVVNNVENIYLSPPLGTNYSITVIGRAVNVNAVTANTNGVVQDYALVVSSGNGSVTNALTVTNSTPGIISANVPNVTEVTNSFAMTTSGSPGISGGLLMNQHVGASSPLQGLSSIGLGTNTGWGTNGVITLGVTNQWHFYRISNTNDPSFTNAAFAVFLSPNLSPSRMGVTNVDDPNQAARIEADIDLYVSSNPALTNLDPTAVAAADKSLGREGTEVIIYTNAVPGQEYYIGVKSEDQQAAEYAFLSIFSDTPFGVTDANGNQVLRGVNVPTIIPDGTPAKPGAAVVLALSIQPIEVRRVVVTNMMTHENFGDLLGNLSHRHQFAVLNNHTFGNGNISQTNVYEDNGENDISISQHTDGPGSLRDFIGEKGAGVWILTEVDNALSHTGRVDNFWLRLEPQTQNKGGTNSVTLTVQPNSFVYDFIDVPAEATNMVICVQNITLPAGNRGPVQLYLRYSDLPTTTTYDYTLNIPVTGNCLTISQTDLPPLKPGRYYFGIYNPNGSAQTLLVSWSFGLNLFGVPLAKFNATGSTPLLDDATMADSTIVVTNHQKIISVDVGVRLDHSRVSDLALTLISPTGKRILLYEDRGGNTAQNLGSGVTVTNVFPQTTSGTAAASTNTLQTGASSGTLFIDYDFFTAPDSIDVYYGGLDIFSRTNISNSGQWIINYGPGASTDITIIVNQNGNTNATTLWNYTATVVNQSYFYLTFTENTNLTQVPIKYALPPFTSGSNAITTFLSGFEGASATNYNSGQIVDGWTVAGNPVNVINDATLANGGSQCLALQLGAVTRVLPTSGGRTYVLRYAYRQNRPLDINGSFETPSVAGTFNPAVTNIDGWTAGFGNVDHIGTYWPAANGTNSVDLNGTQPGSLYRDISTLNGQIYDLRFAYAANPDRLQTNSVIQVSWGGVNITNTVFNNTGFSRANMGWKYAQNQVLGTGTNRLQFGSTNSGDWGPALDDISLTPRAIAAVTLKGTQLLFGQQSWQTNSVTFTSSGTATPVTILATNGGGGMLLDSFTLTQSPGDSFVLPEQSLEELIGDYANGTWTLEIRDSRTGMTNNAQLISWQLRFLFEDNTPKPIQLTHGVNATNTIPPCGMAFFTVDVPVWASAATNIIVSASAPVNVWFNQITPPVGTNPPDIELITGGTSGSFATLTTNGTPPLIPGQRYYLGVQNPCANASNVTVVLRVDYNITALTNGVPLTNQVLTAGVPERYFSYTVTNANASEVLFQLYNLDGNVDLIARKGAPLPDLFNYDYGSFNSGTSPENILVLTNSSPVALSPGIWYLGVFNRASTNVTYTIRATEVGPPTIIPLTNNVPLDFSSGPGPLLTNFFSFTITNSAPSVLFELYNQSGNGDLVLQRSNLPYASPYFASSANPGSNYEQIVIRTNTLGTDINSTWYLAVLNNDPGLITYTIRAVLPTNGMLISGLPINTGVSIPGGTNVQLTWNPTIPGENYQVQTNIDLTTTNWGVLTTINATGTSIIYLDPTPVSGVPMQFYRIVQVP